MNDQFIYSGNRHESVPRALFLDQRLTPLERNAWQIIKMMLEADGITALPTYQQLQPFLTSMPLAEKASSETVARALIILRLTRWLSLAIKRRNKSGAVLGNIYILHDEPLSLYECLQIEPDYLSLLSNALSHSSKAIQTVANHTVSELASDPYLSNKKLPTRLEILTERLSQLTNKELSTATNSEVSINDLLRNHHQLNSGSEVNSKASHSNLLRNPNSISSSKDKNILLQEIKNNLILPDRFKTLSLAQQQTSLIALGNLDNQLRQQVLDEWQHRCEIQTLQKPAAYLHGIIQKAMLGELNLLKTQSASEKPINPKKNIFQPENSTKPPVDKQQAHVFLSQIKRMLHKTPP